MSRFFTPIMILEGKLPQDFGVSRTKGSSLTIPGQGSDLAQIIASIVKLPPIDERSFDVPADLEPDVRALALKADFDALYKSEQVNAGLDAQERQKARKNAKNEGTPEAPGAKDKEPSDADAAN